MSKILLHSSTVIDVDMSDDNVNVLERARENLDTFSGLGFETENLLGMKVGWKLDTGAVTEPDKSVTTVWLASKSKSVNKGWALEMFNVNLD